MCSLCQPLVLHICFNDYPAGIQVTIGSLTLTQKLRAEDDAVTVVLLPNGGCISNRYCGLDYHGSIEIRLHDQLDHFSTAIVLKC